jgi:hypothetical protein
MKKLLFVLLLNIVAAIVQAQNVGIGTSTPVAKLDVNGSVNVDRSIRTKYSGSIVVTVVTGTTYYTNLTIPTLPTGWDFTNTLVLVSIADGISGTINRAKLTSSTNIELENTANGTGPCRFNYIVFKL